MLVNVSSWSDEVSVDEISKLISYRFNYLGLRSTNFTVTECVTREGYYKILLDLAYNVTKGINSIFINTFSPLDYNSDVNPAFEEELFTKFLIDNSIVTEDFNLSVELPETIINKDVYDFFMNKLRKYPIVGIRIKDKENKGNLLDTLTVNDKSLYEKNYYVAKFKRWKLLKKVSNKDVPRLVPLELFPVLCFEPKHTSELTPLIVDSIIKHSKTIGFNPSFYKRYCSPAKVEIGN